MKKLFLTLAFIFILVFACTACDSDTIPDHIHAYGEWEIITCSQEREHIVALKSNSLRINQRYTHLISIRVKQETKEKK